MALKFRLQRFGARGKPFYHVVVINSRAARNSGRRIECVGIYNPMPEKSVVELKKDRIEHWHKIGARPSNCVKNLFRIHNITL